MFHIIDENGAMKLPTLLALRPIDSVEHFQYVSRMHEADSVIELRPRIMQPCHIDDSELQFSRGPGPGFDTIVVGTNFNRKATYCRCLFTYDLCASFFNFCFVVKHHVPF
jgi:hypothetical protein